MLDLLTGRRSFSLPSRQRVADWLLNGVDAGLVGVFLLTALALGGRHDAGRLIYTASVAFASLCLVVRSALLQRPLQAPKWPFAIALLAVAAPLVQLIPLPSTLLATVAPGHEYLLPMWTADSPFGAWSTVSLAPYETIESAALLAAHALLFFVLVNRITGASEARRLLTAIGVAALILAAIALLQKISPNGKLLWFYDYPYFRLGQNVKGTFANKNHLAHYLAFGMAALAPFAFSRFQAEKSQGARRKQSASWTWRQLAGVAAIVLLAVTVLATLSRGAVAAMAAGLVVAIVVRWCVSGFRLAEAIGLVGVASVVLVAVSSFDYDRVSNRMDDLVSGEIEKLDANQGRRLIWEANAAAFAANPWLGHGAGSHRYMYPAYFTQPASREYTHAESSYLQVASENGLLGLAVLLLAWSLVAWWVIGGLRHAETPDRVLLGASVAGGLTVSATHAVVDFVWYVPSLCALAIAFAAVAYRLSQPSDHRTEEPHRIRSNQVSWWRLGGMAVAAPAAAACFLGPAYGSLSWDRYVRVAKTTSALRQQEAEPASEGSENLNATIHENDARSLRLLSDVVEADPNNAHAHAKLANRCLLAFESRVSEGDNPLTLDLIRDAATHGGFGTVQEVRDWAARAFAEAMPLLSQSHHHARASAVLCPLETTAYLNAAGLAFLTGEGIALDRWIEQAIRLRPQDGGVRYEAARLLHAAGRLDEALEQYRVSLRLPGNHRRQLVATLAPLMPASVFLENLDPDTAATELTFNVYRLIGSQEDLHAVAEHAEQAALATAEGSPHDRARCWRQLSLIYRFIERFDSAVACAERAQEASPYDFWVRHELALALNGADRFDDAEPHLRWCLARRPDLRYLQQLLKQGAKQRGETLRLAREKERFEARLAALSASRQQADPASNHDDPNEKQPAK